MPRAIAPQAGDLRQVFREIFVVSDHLNQMILESLDVRAWRAKPPGRGARTIAAIFTHVHNVRRKWLRLSAPHLKLPAQLDRSRSTQKQARRRWPKARSFAGRWLPTSLSTAAAPSTSDGWARPWPGGAAMLAYMVSHEAHHRGQICMLAHQLGFRLPIKTAYGIWGWEKLWKECGFTHPR